MGNRVTGVTPPKSFYILKLNLNSKDLPHVTLLYLLPFLY